MTNIAPTFNANRNIFNPMKNLPIKLLNTVSRTARRVPCGLCLLLAAAAILLCPSNVQATAYVAASTTGGEWTTPSTWVANSGFPSGSADTVTIPIGTSVSIASADNISITSVTFSGTATPSSLTINGALTLSGVLTVAAAGTVNNNGTLTVGGNATGAGALIQGANATLKCAGTGTGTSALSISTVTATATGNTVNFNRAGPQTIPATTYYNLTIDSASTGAKTEAGNITVNGMFTLSQLSQNFNIGANTLTLNGGATFNSQLLNGGTTASLIIGGSTPVTLPTSTLTTLQNLTVNDSGGVNLGTDLTVGNTLTLTSGALSIGANTLTLNGTVSTTSGTLTGINTSVIVCGNSSPMTLPGVTTGMKKLTVNGTGGVALNGPITLISGAGGLDLTAGAVTGGNNLTFNASGTATITRTDGSLTGTPTFTTAVSVTYNGITTDTTTGPELPTGTQLRALTIATGARTVNLNADATVGNSTFTFTLTSGTFAIGAHTLTLNGGATFTVPTMTGGTASGLVIGGTTAVTLPSGLTSLNTLTVNDAGGVVLGSAISLGGTSPALGLTAGAVTGGGNLTLASGTTITRAAGSLTGTPTFSGTVNVTYNNTAADTTSGPELPTSSTVLNNLTAAVSGRSLNLNANATVGGLFTLTSGTFAIGANTLTLNGGATFTVQTMTGGATSSLIIGGSTAVTLPTGLTSLNNLTVNDSGGVNLGTSLTVGNTLTLTSGALSIGANTLTLNGTVSTTSGTLTGGNTSLITCGGSSPMTLPGVTVGLKRLTVNDAGGVALNGPITLLQGAGGLDLTAGAVTGGNNLTFNANGTATITRTDGSLTGTPTFTTPVSVTYNGTTTDTTTGPELPTGSTALKILTVAVSGHTLNLNADATVNPLGTTPVGFTLTSGTFAIGAHTLTLNGGAYTFTGTLTGGTASGLVIGGSTALTLPSSLTSLNNLTVNDAGGVVLGSAISLGGTSPALGLTAGAVTGGGNLTLASGTTITRKAGTLDVAPTFSGTVNVTYNNTAAGTTTGPELPTGSSALNNLANSATAQTVTLGSGSNPTVNGTLTVSANTTLDFNANTVTASGTSFSGTGALKMEVANTSGTFTGSKLTQTAGTLTYAGALTVTATGDPLASGNSIPLFVPTGSPSGWFSSLTLPPLSSGLAWNTNGLATTGNLAVYSFTTTPSFGFAMVKNTTANVSATKMDAQANSSLAPAHAVSTTAASHGTATISAGALTYQPTSGYTGTDTFTVTYSDGKGVQTMLVTVTINDANFGPSLTPLPGTTGSFVASGIPLATYGVQFATDMNGPWSDSNPSTTTAAANGVITYTDSVSVAGHGGTVFYRLKQ